MVPFAKIGELTSTTLADHPMHVRMFYVSVCTVQVFSVCDTKHMLIVRSIMKKEQSIHPIWVIVQLETNPIIHNGFMKSVAFFVVCASRGFFSPSEIAKCFCSCVVFSLNSILLEQL